MTGGSLDKPTKKSSGIEKSSRLKASAFLSAVSSDLLLNKKVEPCWSFELPNTGAAWGAGVLLPSFSELLSLLPPCCCSMLAK
ncbi:hypothetical protein EK904_012779 [Melospiza melodia maxima]|nr:hypothetical protein EK904_012779 [Melospiza melodia maxima]